MNPLPLLLVLPVAAGLALVLARPTRAAAPLGLAVAAATLALAVAAVVTRPVTTVPFAAGLRFSFGVDSLAAALVVTVAVVTSCVLLAAAGDPSLRSGRFVGVVLVFAGAMTATVTATTLPALLVGWEVMGATSWVLIAHHRRERTAGQGATTAFLTTRAADVGLYVAAGAALAGGVSGLTLGDLPRATGGWLALVAAGVVVAALGKSAQLPFSSWLSGAMVGPSPVSALLHSATMVAAGAYLLVRLGPLLTAVPWAGSLVAWVGGLTAVVLGVVAVSARDLKQLLAASTCAQVGTMVLGAGLGASTGAVTGLLVAHAAVKALLFLCAGAWLYALGTRSLPALRGAARRHPVVGVTFTVGALALAGVPPLSLWWTKDAVLATAPPGTGGVWLLGQLAAVLAAVYTTRALWFVWRPASWAVTRAPVPRSTAAALVVLAVPAAAVGAVAVAIGAVPLPGVLEMVGSAVVAVAAVSLTWAFRSRRRRPGQTWQGTVARAARTWWGLDAVLRLVVVRPVLALAALLDAADRHLDRGVHALAGGVVGAAGLADRRGEPVVRGAVAGLAGGVRRLGTLARRPQTGQVHQYYAQALTALGCLGALAVVLVVMRGLM